MRGVRSVAVVLLASGVGMAGCSGIYPEQHGTPSTGSPTATAPATTTAGGAVSNPPVVFADGRYPVYLKGVDPNRRTITLDLIQLYLGAEAAREAAKDHKEFYNDYYIRNVSPRLRTLPVRDDATVIVNGLAADLTGSATKNLRVTLAKLASWLPRAGGSPFWITVEQGQVVSIVEQFIP
jgi:hypothetical protein